MAEPFPVRRAEWLPVERTRAHPTDVAARNLALGCALPFLLVVLACLQGPYSAFTVVALASLLLPALLWLVPSLRDRRDARAFSDLGPRDDDMTEVEIRLFRRGTYLGTDQGYLWAVDGTTCFQGARVAFRVGGPGWRVGRPDPWLADLRGPDGEYVRIERISASPDLPRALPIALSAEGPLTLPPVAPDPRIRPPALGWRISTGLILAVVWTAFLGSDAARLATASVVILLLGAILAVPVWLDRRGRR